MSVTATAVPCALIRGGTSKGVFVLERDLPADALERDRVLVALLGSPHPRQIDGLGGADPLTSKAVIVSPPGRPGIDVEYESVEIGIGESFVNHGIMCGNLTTGVGLFAMLTGLVPDNVPHAELRMFCRNTSKQITARFPLDATTPESRAAQLLGAPADVSLTFEEPSGAVTGHLLPTGQPVDELRMSDGRCVRASVVDAGALYAFVAARDLGVAGSEDAATLDANAPFRAAVEALRAQIAQLISDRLKLSPALHARRLKIAIVSPAAPGSDVDVVARVVNTAKVHKAYAVSGGISLGAATVIRGSVVNGLIATPAAPLELSIGHPSGKLQLRVHWSGDAGTTRVHGAEVRQSARILLRGEAFVQRPA